MGRGRAEGQKRVRGQWEREEVKGEERVQEVKQAQDKEGRGRKCFFFFLGC